MDQDSDSAIDVPPATRRDPRCTRAERHGFEPFTRTRGEDRHARGTRTLSAATTIFVLYNCRVNPKGGRDNPIGEGSGEDAPGWGIRRRPTLRFEGEGRSTTPDPLAIEPPRDTPDPEPQATPILFDGQAAGYRLGRRLSSSDDVYQAVHPRF